MQYAMLVQIWLGTLKALIYGWGFVESRHKKRMESHKLKGMDSIEDKHGGIA